MSILNDLEITNLCKSTSTTNTLEGEVEGVHPSMITPFIDYQVRTKEVVKKGLEALPFSVEGWTLENMETLDYLINDPIREPVLQAHFKRIKEELLRLKEGYREEKVLSYGLDSFGYDVRLDHEIKLFTNLNSEVVDPKNLDLKCLISATIIEERGSEYFLLPPNSYALGKTIEYFNVPRDVTVVCLGKSTYARSGIIINPTSFKPGFSGIIVIEIANTSNLPAKIYVGEGIASCMFFKGNPPSTTYEGAYQNQSGIKLPQS